MSPRRSVADAQQTREAIVDHAIDVASLEGLEGLLTAASFEFDGRDGPVRDAIESAMELWLSVLAREARTAVEAGDLPAGTDPEQVAFELNALAVGANQSRQLHGATDVRPRALAAMERVLS
jgi:hypothetical protein